MLDLSDRQQVFYWQTDRKLTGEEFVKFFLKRHQIPTEKLIDVLTKGITFIPGGKAITIEEPDKNVLRGNVNIVRKVQINGQPFVVRMHPPGVKNGYFFVEKAVLELAGKSTLAVPQVVEVHEAQDEDDMDFMVMTPLTGMTMDNFLADHPDAETELVFACGQEVAKIHQLKVTGFGPFDNQQAKQGKLVGLHSTYDDFIHTALEENLERLTKFEVLTSAQVAQMKTIFEIYHFEPIDGPRLIHNDFADWNVLTDGHQLTGILDWDECHAGDPIADLACWSTFFTLKRYVDFFKGYTSVAKVPDDYELRFHFYRLRYTISKMALRVKRYQVDKDPFVLERINNGREAMVEEQAWFKIK